MFYLTGAFGIPFLIIMLDKKNCRGRRFYHRKSVLFLFMVNFEIEVERQKLILPLFGIRPGVTPKFDTILRPVFDAIGPGGERQQQRRNHPAK